MQPAVPTLCHFCGDNITRQQATHQPDGEGHPMHPVCLEIILKIFPECPIEGCGKPTKDLKAIVNPQSLSAGSISEEEEKERDVARCEEIILQLDEQFRKVFDKQNPEQHMEIFAKMIHVACIQSTLLGEPMEFIDQVNRSENKPDKASALP